MDAPAWVEIGGILVAIVGGCYGFYKAGYAQSQSRNGYVKREDCHRNIDSVNKRFDIVDINIGELHEKVNDTRDVVIELKGFLKGTGK